jgi:hypothetical protein
MKTGTKTSRNYTKLVKLANNEIYGFWDKLGNHVTTKLPLDAVILTALKAKLTLPDNIKYLYKLSTEYPGSSLMNAQGMPLLIIKMRNDQDV